MDAAGMYIYFFEDEAVMNVLVCLIPLSMYTMCSNIPLLYKQMLSVFREDSLTCVRFSLLQLSQLRYAISQSFILRNCLDIIVTSPFSLHLLYFNLWLLLRCVQYFMFISTRLRKKANSPWKF